jgi:hypothetical protein
MADGKNCRAEERKRVMVRVMELGIHPVGADPLYTM